MPRPLDESYENSSDDDDALRVDAAFAKAYSAREQKRLDARRAAGGDGVLDAGVASSSDSESSDDDGAAALTPRVEADVLKTMAAIRRRDAAVYDGTTAFFADAPRARRVREERRRAVVNRGVPAADGRHRLQHVRFHARRQRRGAVVVAALRVRRRGDARVEHAIAAGRPPRV